MTTSVKIENPRGQWNKLKVELLYTRDGLPVQPTIYLEPGAQTVVQVYSETHVRVTETKA